MQKKLVSFFKKRALIPIYLLLTIISCTEPIELNFATSDRKLVVDGFITNVEKEHLVRLSYSSGFNRDGVNVPDRIADALVEIVDDNGNRTQLIYRTQGDYYTPLFKADPLIGYKIVVEVNNDTYESPFQQLPNHNETTKIRYEPQERETLSSIGQIISKQGVGIYAAIDNVDEPVYYQWLQENHYIFEAAIGNRINKAAGGIVWPNIYCYVQNFDRIQIDLYNSLPDDSGTSIEREIDFIESLSYQFHDFAIQVTQLIMNKAAYNYWEAVKEASERVGGIFDPAPYSIKGNLESINGNNALGFFGVHNESVARIFYNNCELALNFRKSQGPCEGPRLLGRPATREELNLLDCYNCKMTYGKSSQVTPPSWWRPFEEDNGCDGS